MTHQLNYPVRTPLSRKYSSNIDFTIDDIAENPCSSLGSKCGKILWDKERTELSISDLFVLEKIDELKEPVTLLLCSLFQNMIKNLYNTRGNHDSSKNIQDLFNVEPEENRISFDAEFGFTRSREDRTPWYVQFKFTVKWDFVTVVLTVGKDKKIVKKMVDQHWFDFFETFCKDMKQQDSFEGILKNIKKHTITVLMRN